MWDQPQTLKRRPRRWTTRVLAIPKGVRWTACAFHLALIAMLSLLPGWMFPPSAAGIPGIDKAIHLAMYGLLGALLRWAAEGRPAWSAGWGFPAMGAAYGLLMEGCQLWLSGGSRSFSWGDAAANLLGVFALWVGMGRLLGDRARPGA